MLRMSIFLCVFPLISSFAFSRDVLYKASGHYECESGPGLTESKTATSDSCALAHQAIEDDLGGPSSLSCYGGAIPVYIDEGCTPYMFRLPGDGQPAADSQFAVESSAPCQWTVKLIYTFASGKRSGVQRKGSTYSKAYQAAWAAICAKTSDPNYGGLCAGTGVCKVTAPEPYCSPQLPCAPTCLPQCTPACAPPCLSRPRCRLLFRR